MLVVCTILMCRDMATTPAVKYGQRDNADTVLCSLNERGIPTDWRGAGGKVTVSHYDSERALTKPYNYMFQKVSDKALGWNPVHVDIPSLPPSPLLSSLPLSLQL